MATYGYARVSSKEQDAGIQISALEAANCDIIRAEKVSATSMTQRVELKNILDFMRADDVLIVTRIDRLARSMTDLSSIVSSIVEKKAFLRVIEQPFDTTKPEGRLMLSMLGAFAEFETDLRRERQREGIEKAKAAGRYKTAKRFTALQREKRILELREANMKAVDIARDVSCSRQHVYKILKQTAQKSPEIR